MARAGAKKDADANADADADAAFSSSSSAAIEAEETMSAWGGGIGIRERPLDFRLVFFVLFAAGVRSLPDDAVGPRFFFPNFSPIVVDGMPHVPPSAR